MKYFIFFYACFAFLNKELNPLEWDAVVRFLYLVISLSAVMLGMFWHSFDDEDGKS